MDRFRDWAFAQDEPRLAFDFQWTAEVLRDRKKRLEITDRCTQVLRAIGSLKAALLTADKGSRVIGANSPARPWRDRNECAAPLRTVKWDGPTQAEYDHLRAELERAEARYDQLLLESSKLAYSPLTTVELHKQLRTMARKLRRAAQP